MTVFPRIVGKKPNLMLALLSTIITFEASFVSVCFAAFVGLLMDTSLNVFVGVNLYTLCVLSYFLGVLAVHFLQKNFLSYLIISTIFITVFYHLQFLFLYVLAGYDELKYAYLLHYLPPMVISWFFSLIFYFFNKLLTMPFRKKFLNFT